MSIQNNPKSEQSEQAIESTFAFGRIKKKLLRFFVSLGVLFIVFWIIRDDLTALIRWPLVSVFPEHGSETILLRVIDKFFVHVKICMYASIMVLIPLMILGTFKYIKTRFNLSDSTLNMYAPIASTTLFYTGILFCFFVVLPAAFAFLVGYSMEGGGVFVGANDSASQNMLEISLSEHVTFTMKLLIGFGLGFQSPVIMAFLAKTGVVSADVFAKQRGVALVVLAATSSILTPPDPWTMVLMLIPLYGLYELGIVVARSFDKDKKQLSQ